MHTNKVLDQFEDYLESRGYKKETPSGSRSTAYDYSHIRIPFVLKEEGIDVLELLIEIDRYVMMYDIGGDKEMLGAKSHRSVINALKRFREFNIDIQHKMNK